MCSVFISTTYNPIVPVPYNSSTPRLSGTLATWVLLTGLRVVWRFAESAIVSPNCCNLVRCGWADLSSTGQIIVGVLIAVVVIGLCVCLLTQPCCKR